MFPNFNGEYNLLYISLVSPHLFWHIMRAHSPSIRRLHEWSRLSDAGSQSRAMAMITVVSTIAMDGGSAEYAGATVLPRIMHQPSVIVCMDVLMLRRQESRAAISPTCTT